MGRKKRGTKRNKISDNSTSGSSGTDSSLTFSTPSSGYKKLKISRCMQFGSDEEVETGAKGGKSVNHNMSGPNGVSSPGSHLTAEPNAGNREILEKLGETVQKLSANEVAIQKLGDIIEELKGTIFSLQADNDKLRAEVREMKEREANLKTKLDHADFKADLAESRCEELSRYIRRNNLRIFGIPEETTGNRDETEEDCEKKILSLCKEKLKIEVTAKDIEAIHRVGKKGAEAAKTPRGIIVRFVSRKTRDSVLYARKNLKGTKMLMVEDLTPRTYALLCCTRENKDVCERAWSKYGRVFMKTPQNKIYQVDSKEDLHRIREKCTQTVKKSPLPSTSSGVTCGNK